MKGGQMPNYRTHKPIDIKQKKQPHLRLLSV